jgi:hypothetical protein
MPVTDFSASAMANGDIHVGVAVMLDTSASFRIIEATAGAKCIGIAQLGDRRDPSVAVGLAAIAGEACKYYGIGAKDVPARIGAGGCTAGDRLKATTAGKLIPVASNNDEYVAIAKQTAIEDDLAAVDVVLGQYGV